MNFKHDKIILLLLPDTGHHLRYQSCISQILYVECPKDISSFNIYFNFHVVSFLTTNLKSLNCTTVILNVYVTFTYSTFNKNLLNIYKAHNICLQVHHGHLLQVGIFTISQSEERNIHHILFRGYSEYQTHNVYTPTKNLH